MCFKAIFELKKFFQVQKCQEKYYATFSDTSIDNFTAIMLVITLKNNGKNDLKALKLSTYNFSFDE